MLILALISRTRTTRPMAASPGQACRSCSQAMSVETRLVRVSMRPCSLSTVSAAVRSGGGDHGAEGGIGPERQGDVGAQRGLGFMISDAAQFFQIPVVFIGIGLIGVIGLLLNAVLSWIESYTVHWLGR